MRVGAAKIVGCELLRDPIKHAGMRSLCDSEPWGGAHILSLP
jgi:hypothetical protein